MINEKNFRQLQGKTVVDKSDVHVVSNNDLAGVTLNRMVLLPGGSFSYVSEVSVATVLQGAGLITDQDTNTTQPLNPGSTYTIDRGTSVQIRNTMVIDLIISFVNIAG